MATGADVRPTRRRPAGVRAGLAATLLALQALVEYGVLNQFARDVTLTLQRLGGWIGDHLLIVAVIVVALGLFLFRRS